MPKEYEGYDSISFPLFLVYTALYYGADGDMIKKRGPWNSLTNSGKFALFFFLYVFSVFFVGFVTADRGRDWLR